MLCWVHSEVWLVSSGGQVRRQSGGRGPPQGGQGWGGSGSLPGGAPQTHSLGQEADTGLCVPATQSIWGTEEGEGVYPAHQSWGP